MAIAGTLNATTNTEKGRAIALWALVLSYGATPCTSAGLNAWLRQNLKAQSLALGDLVAITYHGKKTTRTGTEYNAYGVIVDKGAV